jgi:hypothetical protein
MITGSSVRRLNCRGSTVGVPDLCYLCFLIRIIIYFNDRKMNKESYGYMERILIKKFNHKFLIMIILFVQKYSVIEEELRSEHQH